MAFVNNPLREDWEKILSVYSTMLSKATAAFSCLCCYMAHIQLSAVLTFAPGRR